MSGSLVHTPIGRILFVDQDIAMRKMMESILTKDQFHVVTMSSAEEGLEQMKADEPFDFVISGYTLPGMNGLRFLLQVADIYQKPVRILMSGGSADTDEVNLAIHNGHINRYVSKPFCYATFREDLQNYLASLRAEEIPLVYKTP